MRWIDERIEQTHRNRLDPLGQQCVDLSLGVLRIERALDAPVGVDPLIDNLAQVPLDQWRRLGPCHVVEPRHTERAYLQHVPEALGRDQADARALVLDNGVRRDGCAVADLLDRAATEAALLEHLGEAFDNRMRVVLDARRDLLGVNRAVRAEQHDVGEGAADVDADAISDNGAHSAARGKGAGSCHCTFGA